MWSACAARLVAKIMPVMAYPELEAPYFWTTDLNCEEFPFESVTAAIYRS